MTEDATKSSLQTITEKCLECRLCQKECRFLSRAGNPKYLAQTFDPERRELWDMPFECSLCGLCSSVCPAGLSPDKMFLEMRRQNVRHTCATYTKHAGLLHFEHRGTSRRYTYYALPEGCDTVFFPGCALSGTRPDKVFKLFEHLSRSISSLGIVLDCCTKPSHDLGREKHFAAVFGEMRSYLVENGVRTVLVACPSCYSVFKEYGGDLNTRTVYEVLQREGTLQGDTASGTVTLHDPCAVRYDRAVHEAVRELVRAQGVHIEEMKHHGRTTYCCGEGGAVGFFSPRLSKNWRDLRKREAGGRRIITYCAGCVTLLGSVTPTSHLIDLIFDPQMTMAGKSKVSRAPFTYWNRLRLKKRFKKQVKAFVTRERNL